MSEETKIWEDFRNGNQESLGIIFSSYYQELFLYGLKILAEEELVKESIQNLFIKLWEKRASLPTLRSPKGYLFKILRNLLMDRLRMNPQPIVEKLPAEQLNGHQISIEGAIIRNEKMAYQSQQLKMAVGQLSPIQQEIIYLKFYNQLEYREIAEITNLNYQTVRNYMSQAIKRLRIEIQRSK